MDYYRDAEEKVVEIIRVIIKYDVNVNVQDKEGYTALHIAVLFGNKASLLELLNTGANPFIKNSEDDKPSKMDTSKEIREILKKAEKNSKQKFLVESYQR